MCIVYAMGVIINLLSLAFTMWGEKNQQQQQKKPAGFLITKGFTKEAKDRWCVS